MIAGDDPYLIFNGLDADYRPIGRPDADPRPPRYPSRVRCFRYACARFWEETERRKLEAAAGRGGL